MVFLFSLALRLVLLAQKRALLIGPGDLLHLQVYDTPEMEQRARVTDAGNIPFSFLGRVSVSGLTPEQAAEQIEHRLVAAGVMRHPQVTVRVEAYATQNASVMGQVQKPGVYEIDTSRKVVEVLAMAGGLTDLADRHITIQRAGAAKQKVEYYYSNAAATALAEIPWSTRRYGGGAQGRGGVRSGRCIKAGRLSDHHQQLENDCAAGHRPGRLRESHGGRRQIKTGA